MRGVAWAGAILLLLVFQTTLLPAVAVMNVQPDLLLLVVVSFGLLTGKEHGVAIGFFTGLAQDLLTGGFFGFNTLTKLAAGYFFGMAERQVFKENIFLPLLAVLAATAAAGLFQIAMLYMMGYQSALAPAAIYKVLLAAGYNLLFAIPAHRFVYWLSRIDGGK